MKRGFEWKVYSHDQPSDLLTQLAKLGFVAYLGGKPIGIGRVTASPQSRFSGLWGDSVLPDFRGRGVYRALLSARIDHVRQFDSIRYLRVDAMPTSRPILERYGFKRVASTWPADWPPTR